MNGVPTRQAASPKAVAAQASLAAACASCRSLALSFLAGAFLFSSIVIIIFFAVVDPTTWTVTVPGSLFRAVLPFPANYHINLTADVARGWGYVASNQLWNTAALGPLVGPAQWGSLGAFPACGGAYQSPIALSDAEAQAGAPGTAWLGFRINSTSVYRVGPRVGKPGFEVDPLPEQEGEWEPPLSGGGTFFMEDFHAHAPSEHSLNGQRLALELHFVHKTRETPQRVAVFAVLFDLDDSAESPNPFVATFFPQMFSRTFVDLQKQLDVGAFLADTQPFLFAYNGSLTSPPCTPVSWYVTRAKTAINSEQLGAFLYRHSLLDNARPVQPLNGRRVTLFKA
jgi:carbonic anhydrase